MLARQTIRFSIFLVLGDMLINDGILALRQHCNVGTSVYGWMLQGHTYKTVNAELPHLCVFVCLKDHRCQSFNFVMPHQRCEFNNRTSKAKPGDFISSPDRLYFTRGISRGKFSVFLLTWSTQNKNGFSNLPFSTCDIFAVYVLSHGLYTLGSTEFMQKNCKSLTVFVFCNCPITCFVTNCLIISITMENYQPS